MERIHHKIESFIRTGQGSFGSFALELFNHQFEKNLPYQAYCRSLGLEPVKIKRWQQIPAVPIQAFKSAALTTFPCARAAAVFESSGTTMKTPSRHYFKTLTHYEMA